MPNARRSLTFTLLVLVTCAAASLSAPLLVTSVPGAATASNDLAAWDNFHLSVLSDGLIQSDQTWSGGSTGNNTAWFTTTNWVGGAFAGSQTDTTNTDIATIPATGTTNPNLGINLNFAGNRLTLGGINFTSTANRGVGNSSIAAGLLQLNGATVNGVANTIVGQTSTGALTLQATQSGAMQIALGNATENIIDVEGSGGVNISGVITGTNKNLTVTGSGTGIVTLAGANTYDGATTLRGSTLAVSTVANGGVASGLGKSTNAAANLVFDGGSLRYTGPLVTTNRNFTVNTGKTAVIETTAGDLTISGACPATTGGLTKIGAGLLNLSGQNLYSGNTTISAGALALVGSGSIANSPLIEIAGGAFFDVSVLTTPLTLAPGQSLRASGTTSTGTIATTTGKGLTTDADSSITFSAFNGVTAPLTIQGSGTVTLASTNSVTINTTTPLVANNYVLIAKGAAGAVNGTAPTSLTVGGSGLAAGTIGSLQIIASQLVLHIAADTTSASDSFRSKQTGNWSALSTWESSHDATTWISATAVPDQNANTITIKAGHIVTVDTSTTADQIDILGGGRLVSPGGNLTVNDGTGDDVTVEVGGMLEIGAGTFNLNGQVNVLGTFRLDKNASVPFGTINYDQVSGLLSFDTTGSGIFDVGVDDVDWRAVGGPQNIEVIGLGGAVTMHQPRTVGGSFVFGASVFGSGNLILNGNVVVQNTGFVIGSPTYGPLSTLDYSLGGPGIRGEEWLPGATSGGGYPTSVVIEPGTTLDLAGNLPPSAALQLGGNLVVQSGGALTMTGQGGMTQPLRVIRNLTMSGQMTLSTQPGGDLFVGGAYSASGTMTMNGRRVTLNGASDQTVFGSNNFDDLSILATTARTVQFEGGSTQTVNTDLVMTGTAGNLLSLHSLSPGTQWKLHAPTSQNVNFVDAQDSDASGFPQIFALNSVDSGDNINWLFAQPGTIQFSAATYSANENGGTVTITATRTGGSDGPVSVSFADNTGTATGGSDCATPGVDYLQAGPGATFDWGADDASDKSFGLPLCTDAAVEGDETVNLVLSSPTGGAVLGTNTAVLTIHDSAPPIAIVSTVPADEATNVATNTSIGVTFNRPANPATITVNTSDTSCAGSFQVSSDNFSTCVRMGGQPVASGSDTIFTVTPATLLAEGTTYKIRITTATQDAVGNPLSAAFTQANGFTTTGTPTVQFSSAMYKGAEGTNVSVTVTRSSSVGASTVDLATSGLAPTTAACSIGSGNDYISRSETIDFGNGESEKTLDITLCSDLLIEDPAEAIDLTLSNPNGATLGTQSLATLTILDVANEFSNNLPIDLTNGAQPVVNYPSSIDVEGVSGVVNGVRLSLTNVTALDEHNFEVLLVSPDNRTFRALASGGTTTPLNGATITLEDVAPAKISLSSAITDGQNYQPTNCADNIESLFPPAPLAPYGDPGCTSVVDTFASVFGGINPNGTWKLYVNEHTGLDRPTMRNGVIIPTADGSIGGWGIQFLAPTAAPVSVSGRVLNAWRRGIRNTKVTISGGDLAQPRTMYTADFGYYYFSGLTAGQTYIISVEPRRYTISHPTRVVNLLDSIADIDFVADP